MSYTQENMVEINRFGVLTLENNAHCGKLVIMAYKN
jgi:hypothetical protein